MTMLKKVIYMFCCVLSSFRVPLGIDVKNVFYVFYSCHVLTFFNVFYFVNVFYF